MKVCGLIFFLIMASALPAFASGAETIALKEALKADTKVFEAAEKAIDKYKEYAKKAWGVNVVTKFDKDKGLLYTDWHRVHKGEVEWKIEIMVWGHIYRVDVWERPSIGLFRYPRKGYMCRLEEMRLQQEINANLSL